MKNWVYKTHYHCNDHGFDTYIVCNDDYKSVIASTITKEENAKLIALAPKMLEALTYYKNEYSGAEPSVSVFEKMVDDILNQLQNDPNQTH